MGVGLVERGQPFDGLSRSAAIDEGAGGGQRGRERLGLSRWILGLDRGADRQRDIQDGQQPHRRMLAPQVHFLVGAGPGPPR